MSRQYRSFDAPERDTHRTEVLAVHWLDSGPTISGSLDGELSIWSTTSDGASIGSISEVSPHKGVRSISSSSKSGRVLTSDMVGTVASWETIEERPGVDNDIDMSEDDEAPMNTWQLRCLDSASVKDGSFNIVGDNGNNFKQRAATCHVTQIHPERPLFAATGAWAGVGICSCPDGESSSQGNLGDPIKYFSDPDQITTKRGKNEKGTVQFGRCITFDQSGNKVAVGTDKGVVSLFDVETGSTLAIIRNHQCPSRAVAFTQSGELLIGSDQCSVTLFDLRVPAWASAAALNSSPNSSPQLKESYVDTLKGHEFWITDIKPASDDRHIATSSADGQIKVWDIRGRPTRSIVWQIKEEKPVWSLCWKAGSGAASFVTGSGGVDGRQASGNVRWYQVSGTGT